VGVAYATPSAVDAVDPSPSVSCSPISGFAFPLSTTPVTCTARDARGNASEATFDVNVRFVSPVAWTAVWGEPVGANGVTLVTNTSRTVPIKVEMFANGVRQTAGVAQLVVASCGGQAATTVGLSGDGGRWSGHLDLSRLGAAGCYVATATLDGHDAGSFRLDPVEDAALGVVHDHPQVEPDRARDALLGRQAAADMDMAEIRAVLAGRPEPPGLRLDEHPRLGVAGAGDRVGRRRHHRRGETGDEHGAGQEREETGHDLRCELFARVVIP
jgi:hypothetical protein